MCDEIEVEISKDNSFNVWFDANNNVVWTRHIDGKLYTYRDNCSEVGLIDTLSSLSSMNDDTFKLLCSLRDSVNENV